MTTASETSFSSASFDKITSFLYKGSDAEDRIIRSLRDSNYRDKLICIDQYIVVGKEQYFIGNKKRAYRIYLTIELLIEKYIV